MNRQYDFLLPADLTITALEGLLVGLKTAIKNHSGAEFTIDATGVQSVDTAGIQVLMALDKTLTTRDKRLRLLIVPDVLSRALRNSGWEYNI